MENKETVFCSNCGQKNLSSDKLCSNCGNSLKSIEDSIKRATHNIKDAITSNEAYKDFTNLNGEGFMKADWDNNDMIDFVQKNNEYYIPKFKEMQDFEKNTSWNWASFFLTSNWLFYRKMYGYGAGLMVANIIFACIPFIGWLLNIGTNFVCGFYGNALYLKHVQKQLDSVKGLREDVRHRAILTKGGTNLVLPLVLIFILPILVFILMFFGMTFSMMSNPYFY